MGRRWRWVVTTAAVAGVVWLLPRAVPATGPSGYHPDGPPVGLALVKSVGDERPPFHLHPAQPWRIEFGRGSGWQGLNTVKLDHTGRVVLHRLDGADVFSWGTAALRLSPGAVADVLAAVEENRLTELGRAYHASVSDGTQWVLWVRQGEQEKAVYCDNHFPDPIVRFAERLDEVLSRAAAPDLRWRVVLPVVARGHERELWESIER